MGTKEFTLNITDALFIASYAELVQNVAHKRAYSYLLFGNRTVTLL